MSRRFAANIEATCFSSRFCPPRLTLFPARRAPPKIAPTGRRTPGRDLPREPQGRLIGFFFLRLRHNLSRFNLAGDRQRYSRHVAAAFKALEKWRRHKKVSGEIFNVASVKTRVYRTIAHVQIIMKVES